MDEITSFAAADETTAPPAPPAPGPATKLVKWFSSHVFGSIEGAVRGVMVPAEFFRALAVAMGASGGLTLLMAICNSMLANASKIFPDPTVNFFAVAFVTLVLKSLQQLSTGDHVATGIVVATEPVTSKPGADGVTHTMPGSAVVSIPSFSAKTK